MTKFWKAALTATILTASAAAVSGCVDAYGYDNGYAAGYGYGPYDNSYGYGYGYLPNGGVAFSYDSGGYCDAFGCPGDYWDLPIYYGPVYFGGSWYNGPVYYRDRGGRRQYWIHGGWHNDEWRGQRPRWWHEGRYGPALGRDFYRSHGFRGRSGNDGGFDNRRIGPPRIDNRRNDNIRSFDNRRVAPPRVDNRRDDNVRRFDNRQATPPQIENRDFGDRGLVNRGPDGNRTGNRNSGNRNVERGRDRRDPGIVNRRDFRGGAARQPQVRAAPPRQAPRQENNNRGRRSDERDRDR